MAPRSKSQTPLDYQPVIGIVSHPGDGASGRLRKGENLSYIAASYVKFVEAAGARVVPLIYNDPLVLEKLKLVNGVLFTGGGSTKKEYVETVRKIFEIILEKNNVNNPNREHFPLYAICLGFELILTFISGKHKKKILENFGDIDHATSLQFEGNAKTEETLFQRFPPKLLDNLETEKLAMLRHQFGISPDKFAADDELKKNFKILTTCKHKEDKVYVSTVRSKGCPIYGFQWHPEKNAFEWGSSKIPHSQDAIQITQCVANHLVSEARESKTRPDAKELQANLIYNYSPTYSAKDGYTHAFDYVYIFSPPEINIVEQLAFQSSKLSNIQQQMLEMKQQLANLSKTSGSQ